MKKDEPKRYKKVALKNGKIRSINNMASVAFSEMLQRIESYLFLDKILKECIRCNIPCAPKHDSLLYPKSYEPRVKRVMRKVLDKYLGEGNYEI